MADDNKQPQEDGDEGSRGEVDDVATESLEKDTDVDEKISNGDGDCEDDEEEEEVEKIVEQDVTLGLVLSVAGLKPPKVDEDATLTQEDDPVGGIRFRFMIPGMQEPAETTAVSCWDFVHADAVDPLASDDDAKPDEITETPADGDVAQENENVESADSHLEGTTKDIVEPTLTFKLNVAVHVDLAWARALDKNPYLVLTAVGPADDADNVAEGDETGSAPSVSRIGAVSLDLSPLLDGETSIAGSWGSYPGCEQQYLSPSGLLDGKLQGLKARVVASMPCLTPDLCEVVNPLTIALKTVRPLPGLIVEEGNAALEPYVTDPITKDKDAFLLQKRYCEPVHAHFYVLPRLLGNHRRVQTPAYCQGKNKVAFSATTTVLVGELDRDLVAEALETDPVRVCLHDRDVPLISTDRSLETLRQGIPARYAKLDGAADEEAELDADANGQAPEIDDVDAGLGGASNGAEEVESTPALRRHRLEEAIYREECDILARHAAQQTFGEAMFSLAELWTNSSEIIDRHRLDLYRRKPERFGNTRKAVSIKVRAGVTPVKRTFQLHPDVKKADLDLDAAERMVRQPGRYMEAGTEMRLAASITFPVHHHEKSIFARRARKRRELEQRKAPFERVVFLFEYKCGAYMQELRAVLQDVNARALPEAVSLRSHQLSDEERARADDGSLDILTGFQVVDDHFRVVVIEGLAAGAIEELTRRMPRRAANTEQLRILRNARIRFHQRLYTCFDVDLKIIRLRDPLCYIMQAAEIYDSFKVDLECHNALCRLSEMRSTLRAKTLFRSSLFPTPAMLTKLESKYGESVSVEDMDGVPRLPRRGSRRGQNQLEDQQKQVDAEGQFAIQNGEEAASDNEPLRAHSAGALRRKAATDSRNDAYLASIAARVEKDHLAVHRKTRQRIKRSTKARMAARAEKDRALLQALGQDDKQIFMYSGQKLNFVEMQQDRLRQRLATHANVTYTYSKDFQSLAFPLVNEERVAKNEAEAQRAKFITKRGFVYPAPRESSEARKGKREISEARAEELKEPWEDPALMHRPARSDHELDFDCIPTNDNTVFGGYHKDGSRNPEFFRSVHLSGDGVEAEAQARKAQEHQEWLDRVVVDTLDFKAHQGVKGEKPTQLDKIRDILDSKPRKKGIYMVRNVTLPSGKRAPLRAPPVSIMGPSAPVPKSVSFSS
ncbi:Hypothetical Protein FCC1311_099542 [Hondaea fermentalgiana]|uniref:Uncharacterized protein n=1 Tax=Hondaea fermentalgiana TaxID=2315210 RepID=A0A2R5GZ33_9STRA|nr:Hypothetical Protein FCC1311_099542 [Hondaea fermentalgiana]|eukprot:GBG33731.1 Hypothetical Protein FCC1311_099542 [Hondaea fermentalgiana]